MFDGVLSVNKSAAPWGNSRVITWLKRGNLSQEIRQSRASRELSSWASVETLYHATLHKVEEKVHTCMKIRESYACWASYWFCSWLDSSRTPIRAHLLPLTRFC